MREVVITGAAGSVGSRVSRRFAEQSDLVSVSGVDLQAPRGDLPIVMHLGDLRSMDLVERFRGADTVVHLASAFGATSDGIDVSQLDTQVTQRTLAAADEADVQNLVVLSSAMVYGAWANNPLPLTEQAVVRPNPDFAFAEHKAEVERLADDWHRSNPGSRVAVLRPTTALASGESSWVARTMRYSASLASDHDPSLQFLHLDDLATAVVIAVHEKLDGAYNVAPDGWVKAEEVRQLAGRAPRLRMPSSVAAQVAETSWRHRLAPTPPGIVPYTTFPWVIANDKIKAAGWEPSHSNVEAYVEGHSARPWAMMNSKRRQQMAIGAAGGAVAVGAGALRLAMRRWKI